MRGLLLAKAASAKPKPFRRARLGVASLIALALGAVTAGVIRFTETGQTLDLMVSDYLRRANPLPEAPADAPAVTVEIDDKCLKHPVHDLYVGGRDGTAPSEASRDHEQQPAAPPDTPQAPAVGRWPWSRLKQGDFVEAIASLGPRFIALDIEYSESEAECVAVRPTADGGRESFVLQEPDRRFRESLRQAGHVLVPFSLYLRGRAGTDKRTAAAAEPADADTAPADGPQAGTGKEEAEPDAADETGWRDYLLPHTVDLPADTGRLLSADKVNPMIEPLAAAAVGSGFTSLHAKDPDQAVRRVPLLARAGDHVFPHMGLEMAGLWQFGPDYRVRLDEDRLYVTSPDGSLWVSVPVDTQTQLNLRWPEDVRAVRRHSIAAGPLLDLLYYRQSLSRLDTRWRLVMEDLASLAPAVGWAEARRALDAAVAATGRSELNLAQTSDADAEETLAPLRERLAGLEERLVMDVMTRAAQAEQDGASDADRRAARAVGQYGPFISTYHAERERCVADLRQRADRVRPRVRDKAVIVGVAITAGTDFHKTPISDQQPGVEVYPAVMRTILSGVAFSRLGPWMEWAIAVLAAWMVGILASRLPTGWATAAAVWMAAIVLGGAYLAAGSVALLLPVAGPVLAVVVAFAGVSAYRQLTEERSRRHLARLFGQYNSPELLDEIQRNPEVLRLGGARREITVLFSDVAGFTPLSERMDPKKLVALLQHYLGTMTAILYDEQATLDKYEGDGIMAFVGAPIQVDDHALRAVRAAIAMQDALPGINDELVRMGLLEEGTRLRIRVGCSSGPANVGNFGSEARFDYTAMGDVVNLGGRLEEANRWLGTRILVSEATRHACGEAVLFREVGLARIRGKAEPLRLFEPLALEPAPDPLRRVAEAFGRAVAALESGDLDAAESALADLLEADPDDAPAHPLRRRIEAARAGKVRPGEPWNLARPKEDALRPPAAAGRTDGSASPPP